MDYKEYKECIKNFTREELLKECLVMKAAYDKSCRSWVYTESLRATAMQCLNELQYESNLALKKLTKKYQELVTEYHNKVKTESEHFEQLDTDYMKEMEEAKKNEQN